MATSSEKQTVEHVDGLQQATGSEGDVYRLLNPQSIAVVGASSRPGSLAWWPVHLLQRCGFGGQIYPVNPGHDEIEGLPAYRRVQEIPGPVDVAVIPLNAASTLEAIDSCGDLGVGSVVLPTQGFSEMGEGGKRMELQLVERAKTGGMRVVGPNTDGVANLSSGAVMSIQPLFEEGIEPGPVGVVAQSGATAASLMIRLKHEGIGVGLSASAGNEADLGIADYMSVMLQDPRIKMVVGFVEAVRRPRDFYNVAALAAELDKPIALIKVGRSEQGIRRASAHTGALAGSDQIYDAIFRRYGVIRVHELSELVAVAKTYLSVGNLASSGIGIISGSGGQAGAAADKAIVDGVAVPALPPASESAIDDLLQFGSGFNPCDLTGEIATKPVLASQVYEEFSKTPAIGAVVYIRKKLLGDVSERSAGPLVESSLAPGRTPLLIYSMDGFVEGVEAKIYRDRDVAVFNSLAEINASVRGLGARTQALTELRARAVEADQLAAASSLTLPSGVVPDDLAKALCKSYGLPLPQEIFAEDTDSAVAAAETIGYPVVVKVVSAQISHKTEMGGVELDLRSAGDVRAAASAILERAKVTLGGVPADGVIVQEQVVGGVEMIVGLKIDPDFGPFVLLGMGGTAAELFRDVTLRAAPVRSSDVNAMIDDLRTGELLKGFRNAPKSDIEALTDVVCNLSRLGSDLADQLTEVDLNPVVIMPDGSGARVVDALFVGLS